MLSNLGDREAARLLVLRFEGPLDDEQRAAPRRSCRSRSSSPRCCATLAPRREPVDPRGRRGARSVARSQCGRESRRWNACSRCKKVPLFESLTLDQLDAIDQLAEERDFLPGEVIVREGDAGGELFLLLDGARRGVPRPRDLATQERLRAIAAVDYFGEMAILDDQPRSATVVARRALAAARARGRAA